MSIVVYWLEPDGVPAHRAFAADALLPALAFSEQLRRAGQRHVCLSSELAHSVGSGGVAAVENRTLPDGAPYEWSKAHRGAGPGPK
jgi:hypothetical protein